MNFKIEFAEARERAAMAAGSRWAGNGRERCDSCSSLVTHHCQWLELQRQRPFSVRDDALGDDHRGGSYHDGGGSESGQRWRSMTACVRVRWPTPLLTAARGCGSGG
jgi:hypothetical protein